MLASASLVAPVLFPQSAVDYSKAFDVVTQLEWSYNVLVTSAQKPYRSMKDLIDELRRHPSDLTFASGGNGSPPHLVGELLNLEASVEGRHVPYQQVTQAVTDLIAGVTDYMFLGAAVAVQLIKAGRLLAVTSSARVPALPGVPTMAESGYPGFIIRPFDGLLARKGTPPGNVRELENVLERGVIMVQGDELLDIHHLSNADDTLTSPSFFGIGHMGQLATNTEIDTDLAAVSLRHEGSATSVPALAELLVQQGKGRLLEMEDALVRAAIRQAGGNITRAAGLLGISRAQMDYRHKKIDGSAN